MEERSIYQKGVNPIYIERNEGEIYVNKVYTEQASDAFYNASYELQEYTPTLRPAICREEVAQIKDWIEKKASEKPSSRLALLYGKAGIGKSVVMHDLLKKLQAEKYYVVLGLKSDQIEFVDTDELSKKIHLVKPIEIAVKNLACQYRRVILLIDQIDALSLSLSSNRTPLRSLLKLIGRIQNISNVRVVISCRPYDLEYDPLLGNLGISNKWELKEFTKDQVQSILRNNKCEERMSDNLLLFLGNPLHLYLFLKVMPSGQMTGPLSADLLYHQLWRKYILDDSVRKVDKKSLLALMDALVTTMYERQELSVHLREYETTYSAELQYLFSHELLLKTKNNQIQFFHQTLFDYVYARRFTEKDGNLLEKLRGQHQGLFSRAAVKSILTFLREQNPKGYIYIIDQLLYSKNEDGKETYRYHLKALALSNMVYFDIPLQEEINLISRKIFLHQIFMDVLFESICGLNWFNAIWKIIDNCGGWKRLSTSYKENTISMCKRLLWLGVEEVLDKIDIVLDYKDEEDCRYLCNLFQICNLNCSSEKLIAFYNKLVKSRFPLEHIDLLESIMKENPEFVSHELKENIRLQLLEKKSVTDCINTVNNRVRDLYEKMLKSHHDVGIQLLVDILKIVYDKSKCNLYNYNTEIGRSLVFFSFHRVIGGGFHGRNLAEDIVNYLIEDFLNNLEKERVRRYIAEFSQSEHEGFVFIALYIYTEHPEQFKDDICNLIISRSVLCNAPSWVEYQAVEALAVAFPLWNDEQKLAVICRILSMVDSKEHRLLFKDTLEKRLQYGNPLLNIDQQKGMAFYVIPKEELRRLSWEAYQEWQRIDRKFNENRLKNRKPSSMSSHIGESSLQKDQGAKMNTEAWHKSMLAYTHEPIDWNRPSLEGQCHLFRMVVREEPDKFIGLIDSALDDSRVHLGYMQAGMHGLLDAGRMDDAMHVLERILDIVHNDVNSTERGFSMHRLLFILDGCLNINHVPELVFRLLCNVLLNANEPEEDTYQEDMDVFNEGINQTRGNAGYMLIQCAEEAKYEEDIFRTIESIAETASVYTRAAVLSNMALLNRLDKRRNVRLFKKLMHDFNPRLMALPIHDLNPLVYFINYAADELMDFFSHAADCPECYHTQVIILWWAWRRNNRDKYIKVFLDKMCENSQEARISLLESFATLGHDMNEDAICYILHFMAPQFASPEMGENCDGLFYNANDWDVDAQSRIADAFVDSPVSKYRIQAFIDFLAGFAVSDPIQTLKWLNKILANKLPDNKFIINNVVDVIIQVYNGIKSFNDKSYQEMLEHAMDLIDDIMKSPDNMITDFINKLDNE